MSSLAQWIRRTAARRSAEAAYPIGAYFHPGELRRQRWPLYFLSISSIVLPDSSNNLVAEMPCLANWDSPMAPFRTMYYSKWTASSDLSRPGSDGDAFVNLQGVVNQRFREFWSEIPGSEGELQGHRRTPVDLSQK